VAQTVPRLPCPECGGTSLTTNAVVSEALTVSERFWSELTPGSQVRNWELRWKLIKGQLQSILEPRIEAMSGELIHFAAQELFSFFISTYHLKDALKEEASAPGLKPADIESAISGDSRLALLADLANLDKHFRLKRPPRSGVVPVVGKISGVDHSSGRGWQVCVKIQHGSRTMDALLVARDSVDAWRHCLTGWHLI